MIDQAERAEKPAPDKFRFKFSPLMIAVFAVLLALCVAGFGVTTWQFTDFLKGDISSPYEWIKYALLYFVSVLLAVLIVAMLIKSQYIVTESELIVQFGFIKSRYLIRKIFSVRLFQGSRKLAVYFDDFKTDFTVIVVKEEWYEAFVEALQRRNGRISFDYTTAEEENNFKKKK